MEEVERALFGVSLLEDHSGLPDDVNGYVQKIFHGDGTRIWYDKCFTILAFADGRVGWHFEHTFADAPGECALVSL